MTEFNTTVLRGLPVTVLFEESDPDPSVGIRYPEIHIMDILFQRSRRPIPDAMYRQINTDAIADQIRASK